MHFGLFVGLTVFAVACMWFLCIPLQIYYWQQYYKLRHKIYIKIRHPTLVLMNAAAFFLLYCERTIWVIKLVLPRSDIFNRIATQFYTIALFSCCSMIIARFVCVCVCVSRFLYLCQPVCILFFLCFVFYVCFTKL